MAVLFGFYSEQGAKLAGSFIYETPDGRKVEVTNVTPDRDGSEYMWPDKVFLGEVSKWISKGKPAELMRC